MDNSLPSDQPMERYSRNIRLSEVGAEGQKKLLRSSAFVVGTGGLGSPALLYLAAAGVGRIGIADGETIEVSNLNRQIIHPADNVGRPKTESAEKAIRRFNPDCRVQAVAERLSANNIRQVLHGYDVVLDCSDNFPTRLLVSDCCRFEKVPLVTAAVMRFEGQLMTILPGEGNPCYRCYVPELPPDGLIPTTAEVGVLGAVAGVMGSIQAVEAIKVILGLGDLMSDRLVIYDGLAGHFATVRRRPAPACPLCGRNPTITDLTWKEGDTY